MEKFGNTRPRDADRGCCSDVRSGQVIAKQNGFIEAQGVVCAGQRDVPAWSRRLMTHSVARAATRVV